MQPGRIICQGTPGPARRFSRSTRLGIVLLLAGWAGTGISPGLAQDADRRPAPRLVCPEPEYAFGVATNTRDIIHDFVIRNDGDAPLKIAKVKLPCGCMLLRLMDDSLDPGEETVLRARFPLQGLSGPQRKHIVLLTNDPHSPMTTLLLTGEAIAELDIRPRQLFWGNLREDAAVEKTVEVRFHDDEDYHVVGVEAPSPLFAAEVETIDGKPANRIKVRTMPPLARGSFQGALMILTDHPRFATLAVPMSGRVIGDLYAIPGEIVLAPASQPVTRTLMIYSSRKQKFSVLGVKTPATNIEVKVKSSLFSGRRVELRNIVPDKALDGQGIVIMTDYAPMKELTVPLRVRNPDDESDRSPQE